MLPGCTITSAEDRRFPLLLCLRSFSFGDCPDSFAFELLDLAEEFFQAFRDPPKDKKTISWRHLFSRRRMRCSRSSPATMRGSPTLQPGCRLIEAKPAIPDCLELVAIRRATRCENQADGVWPLSHSESGRQELRFASAGQIRESRPASEAGAKSRRFFAYSVSLYVS
jgi:hypothetical protein